MFDLRSASPEISPRAGGATTPERRRRALGRSASAPMWAWFVRRSGSHPPAGVDPTAAGAWNVQTFGLGSYRASYPSIHRPPRPARAAGRPRRAGQQPALVLAPARRRTCSRRSTPTCGSGRRTTRCACWARCGRARLERAGRRPGVPGAGSRPRGRTCTTYLTGDRWYQRRRRRRRTARDRVLLPGVRHHRGPAAVLRRPRHPRRRPPQGGQSDLGVPIVGVGLLYRHGYFRSRSRARAGSRRTTRCSTPTGCR